MQGMELILVMCVRSDSVYQETEYEKRYNKMIKKKGWHKVFTYFSHRQKHIGYLKCIFISNAVFICVLKYTFGLIVMCHEKLFNIKKKIQNMYFQKLCTLYCIIIMFRGICTWGDKKYSLITYHPASTKEKEKFAGI